MRTRNRARVESQPFFTHDVFLFHASGLRGIPLRSTMIPVLATLLDLLAPPVSLTDVPGVWVTNEERAILRRTIPRRLDRRELAAMDVHHLDILVAAGTYGDSFLLRQAIRRFKYHNVHALRDEMGDLVRRSALLLPSFDDAVVCPVPLHWTRRFERGWNQAEVLARTVSDDAKWPMAHLLKRVRATGAQAKRSRSERRTALGNAFVVCAECPRVVVLVDDVCTTGSTLDACAAVLKIAGAQTVVGVVVALG